MRLVISTADASDLTVNTAASYRRSSRERLSCFSLEERSISWLSSLMLMWAERSTPANVLEYWPASLWTAPPPCLTLQQSSHSSSFYFTETKPCTEEESNWQPRSGINCWCRVFVVFISCFVSLTFKPIACCCFWHFGWINWSLPWCLWENVNPLGASSALYSK